MSRVYSTPMTVRSATLRCSAPPHPGLPQCRPRMLSLMPLFMERTATARASALNAPSTRRIHQRVAPPLAGPRQFGGLQPRVTRGQVVQIPHDGALGNPTPRSLAAPRAAAVSPTDALPGAAVHGAQCYAPRFSAHCTCRAQRTFHAESFSRSRGLSQAHGNSVACNIEPRVTRAGSAPMTVRSATLLHPASSAIRLAHLQDFREWITRPVRSRAALHLLMQRRASQA
jgi:hypothetical protein